MDQLRDEVIEGWRFGTRFNANLRLLSQRRPREFVMLLEKLFGEQSDDNLRDRIANEISLILDHLDGLELQRVVVATLAPFLFVAKSENVRDAVAFRMGTALARIDASAAFEILIETLIPLRLLIASPKWPYCFDEATGHLTNFYLVDGIARGTRHRSGSSAGHFVTTVLVPCFEHPGCTESRRNLAESIGDGLRVSGINTVTRVLNTTLLRRIVDPEYRDAAYAIAGAIVQGLKQLDVATAKDWLNKRLKPYLDDPKQHESRNVIEWTVAAYHKSLEPQNKCESGSNGLGLQRIWYSDALGVPRKTTRAECRPWYHAFKSSSKGPSAKATKKAIDALLSKSIDTDFDAIWWRLKEMMAQGLPMLSSKEALPIANKLTQEGREDDLFLILRIVPELYWYIRRIADDLTPKRLEYGVCERNSPELLFDPELQAPPPESIRILCEPARVPPAANWLQSSQIRAAIEGALRANASTAIANAFVMFIGTGATQTRKLGKIVSELEKWLTPEQGKVFFRPKDGSEMAPKKYNRKSREGQTNQRLVVNESVLNALLEIPAVLLEIAKVVDSTSHPDWSLINAFGNARYCCPECGALHLPDNNLKFPQPKRCIACHSRFAVDVKLQEHPGKILVCREGQPPIEFALTTPTKVWPNLDRQVGSCPAIRCERKRHRLT